VIQCRSSLGFTLKTADRMGAVGVVMGQELKTYKAAELWRETDL
jgi:hypothetical protein